MKRTRINPISAKKRQQMLQEKEVKQQLLIRAGNKCEECGSFGDFRGLSKHEIKPRSRGGDPTDPLNCRILCGDCHDKAHHRRV